MSSLQPAVWRASLSSVVKNPIWWRQQMWVSAIEVLMGFLGALGLTRAIPLPEVAAGLALVYILSAGLVRHLASAQRLPVILFGLLAAAFALASGLLPSRPSWWSLTVACGILVAFRDAQVVHSLIWMPAKARRHKGEVFQASQWGLLISTVHLTFWMVVSGWMMKLTPWWPAMVLLAAIGIGIPMVLARRPRRRPLPPPARLPEPAWQRMRWFFGVHDFRKQVFILLGSWKATQRKPTPSSCSR